MRCSPMSPIPARTCWWRAATAIRGMREALFGGVTRTLLGSQTLPLFLSR